MSDFDDSCPSSVERGEWVQYYTWFSKQVGMTPDDDIRRVTRKYNNISLAKQKIVTRRGVYTNYSHTVVHHVIAIDDVTEIVKIIIKESIADQHSDGGSSFRINAGSRMFKQVCPTKDYFNGTYLSCCTIDKSHLNSSYTITISVQFVKFDAFSTKSSSNNKKIWSRKFIMKETSAVSTAPQYQNCEHVEYLDTEDGYWISDSSKRSKYQKYIIEDISVPGSHCAFHVMDLEKLTSCFEKKFNHTMTMIGDSHIRYAFFHLINLSTGKNIARHVHHDIKVTTHYFKWKPYCKDLVRGLKEYTKQRYKDAILGDSDLLPKYHLLILGVGHWDLRIGGAQVIILRNVINAKLRLDQNETNE